MDISPSDITVLVADDEESIRDILEVRLRREGFNVETAVDGEEALRKIRSSRFDIVFLDELMPYIRGTRVLEKVRQDFDSHELPIIMMVERGNTGDMARGLDAGANDCIEKPINFNVTLARIETQLELVQQHERIRSLVQYDTETKLFNREFLIERLNVELERVRRHGGQLTVMMVEFHTGGEELPDHLLEEIAEQLNDNLRTTDILGRYHDNQFGLVLPETRPDYTAEISRRLMHGLSRRGIDEQITFSIGTATTESGEPDPDDLIQTALRNCEPYEGSGEERDREAG